MTTNSGVSFEHITPETDGEWHELVDKGNVAGQPEVDEDLWWNRLRHSHLVPPAIAALLLAGGVYYFGNSDSAGNQEVPLEPEERYDDRVGSLSVLSMPPVPQSAAPAGVPKSLQLTPEDLQIADIYEGIFLLHNTSLSYRLYVENGIGENRLSSDFMIDANKLLEIASMNVDPEIKKLIGNDFVYLKYTRESPSDYPITISIYKNIDKPGMVVAATIEIPKGIQISDAQIMTNLAEIYGTYAQIRTEIAGIEPSSIESFRIALTCANNKVTYGGYTYILGDYAASAITEEQYSFMVQTLANRAK